MFRRGISCVFGVMNMMSDCHRRGDHVSHVDRMVGHVVWLMVWHSNMVDWRVSLVVQRFWMR